MCGRPAAWPSLLDGARLRRVAQDLVHALQETVRTVRLAEERVARLENRLLVHRLGGISGSEQHADVRTDLGQLPGELAAAHLRHHEVGHENVERALVTR